MTRSLFFIFLFLFASEVFAQIRSPFYQSFDYSFNFWRESVDNPAVPGSDVLMMDLHRWTPRKRSNYFQNYWYYDSEGGLVGNPEIPFSRQDLKPYDLIQWEEPERHEFVKVPGRKGRSLKLTTLDQYDNAGAIDDDFRSRTEIILNPEHGEGSEYFYSWSFLIPDDGDHPDDRMPDNIIGQWHEPENKDWILDDAKPPFFLIYKNNPSTSGNLRQLGIMYGLRYKDTDGRISGNYFSFPIEKEIEKGKWTDIILHIYWSAESDKGFLEIWINGEKVRYNGMDRFYDANLYTDTNGVSYPNYLKIGQYRQGQTLTQSIYIDDLRIGSSFEEVNSRISLQECATEKQVSIKDWIYTNEVIGNGRYQFFFPEIDKMISQKSPRFKVKKRWADGKDTLQVMSRFGPYKKSNTTDGFGETCTLIFNDSSF